MQAVKYARPSTLEEAIRTLESGGPTARVLAGGTDVIVQARERTRDVGLFVDIKHIPEVMGVSYDARNGLTIGAATPCYLIYGDADVRDHYPCLVEPTSVIGGKAIQGRASLGGNLCNASPAGDSIPAMIVLRAVVNVVGPNGERSLSVEDFCAGPGQNVLTAGEIVVSIHFPPPPPESGAAWQRFTPRNEMDIAVTNAAASVAFAGETVTSARVAIGAVAPTPLLVEDAAEALVGRPFSADTVAAAAAASRAAARPIDDMRGSVKQRKHLAAVLTERVLNAAAERARGS